MPVVNDRSRNIVQTLQYILTDSEEKCDINVDVDDLKYTKCIWKSQQKLNHYIDQLIEGFNNWIGPNLKYYKQCDEPKHKVLLDLIDKKYLNDFYKIATKEDKARIKSISSNGASSWLDVVPNNMYGQQFSNMEYYVALSLYLGCDIISNDSVCNKCGQKVDKKGYHALHCK